jgi:hypothetical protein
MALPAAFKRFNGFYARYPNYILTNPIHNNSGVPRAHCAERCRFWIVPITVTAAQLARLRLSAVIGSSLRENGTNFFRIGEYRVACEFQTLD